MHRGHMHPRHILEPNHTHQRHPQTDSIPQTDNMKTEADERIVKAIRRLTTGGRPKPTPGATTADSRLDLLRSLPATHPRNCNKCESPLPLHASQQSHQGPNSAIPTSPYGVSDETPP
jgi:hypothetical protein